jgi:hypothetical protein
MEKLISLFREPEEAYAAPSPALQASLKAESNEPLYFQQLLEYLRKEREHQQGGNAGAD